MLICVNSWLQSTTWHIKLDGTGNFTTIQEGINASTDSDTVLVYPDTYFENIDFSGKNITVASFFLTTGNEQYLNQTIINGNQSGSCVKIISGEDDTTLFCGFTLTNGSGSSPYPNGPIWGGGIYINSSQPIIEKCLIINNNAFAGGGILCWNAIISLIGVTIKNNHAYNGGGGIVLGNNSEINFDQNELSNIYLNYASLGCELAKGSDCPPLDVYVDTFTVAEPDEYYIYNRSSTGVPINDVTLYMQNAKLEPVNSDLYVSTDGDNSNSGLTPDEPLKNINYALSLVKSDTLHPNTIHIANGTYSNSLNNDCFSLNMRGYVSLVGESMENTILDAEFSSSLIKDAYSKLDYELKNLTLINGNESVTSAIYITAHQQQDKSVSFENITITNCQNYNRALNLIYMDVYIKNLYFYSNYCACLYSVNSYQPEQEIIIENIYIHDNHQYDPADPGSDARPQLSFGMLGTEPMNVTITNMELTENIQYQSDWPESCSGVSVGDNVNLNLINCTIGNNSSPGNGGAINIGPAGQNSVVNIYNSILYGDNPGEIYIFNEFSSNPSTVNIHNSLVDGGYEGIENINSWNIVNWMEGNLDEDPCWDVNGEYPYMLTGNSPCIDAGTLDLPPGLELPEFDLAGNPRIYGETIDIGAYEWQGTGVSDEELIVRNWELSNYPNPFNPTTTISFSVTQNSDFVNLEVYNVKGQKIKTLHPFPNPDLSGGTRCAVWDGTDENNKPVSSGIYMYQLKVDGKAIASKKCLLLK